MIGTDFYELMFEHYVYSLFRMNTTALKYYSKLIHLNMRTRVYYIYCIYKWGKRQHLYVHEEGLGYLVNAVRKIVSLYAMGRS